MIAALARLIRVRVGLLATAGALAGYVQFLGRPAPDLAAVLAGTFLLAAGCSALNQAQERGRDAAMGRTAARPLPAGGLVLSQALGLSGVLLAAGLGLLLTLRGPGAALAGVLALAVYNGLYTPLKTRTPLALLVGGAAGAAPPVLGWLAAGGGILDPPCLLLAGIFYCWQVPHFGLIARLHHQDYRTAGFAAARLGGEAGPRRFPLRGWLAAYGASVLLLPTFGLVGTVPAKALLVLNALALAPLALALDAETDPARTRRKFTLVNASLLVLLAGLTLDALWLGAGPAHEPILARNLP